MMYTENKSRAHHGASNLDDVSIGSFGNFQ